MGDLCQKNARLVVVAPHPDDEVLACGGLLAMRSKQGLSTLVVAVTDGEASHGTEDAFACARLGARRAEESYAGLSALGLSPTCVVRLGIPDGQVANMVSHIAQKLGALLKESDVVLTTWAMDGHPDHESTSKAARLAATEKGCALLQAPVWMWHWAAPGDSRVPWRQMIALDLSDHAMKAKQVALSHHRSQLEARSECLGPVLVPSIVERANRTREYFFY